MHIKHSFLFITVLLWIGFWVSGCDDKTGLATADNQINPPAAVQVSIVKIKAEPIRDVILLPGTTEV